MERTAPPQPNFSTDVRYQKKKERYTILKAFFNDLAELDPSFHGFANSKVFQDMSDLNFIPGNDTAMAHHRLGILALKTSRNAHQGHHHDDRGYPQEQDIQVPPANMDGLLHLHVLNHY